MKLPAAKLATQPIFHYNKIGWTGGTAREPAAALFSGQGQTAEAGFAWYARPG